MSKVFDNSNKIWSIYTEKSDLKMYTETIKKILNKNDFDDRINISKDFYMTDLEGVVHIVIDITVICTEEEIEKIQRELGLIDC